MDAQFQMKTSVCYTFCLFVLFIFCQILSRGYEESAKCTPGFESELFVFKVNRDHHHRGKQLGKVTFSNCDGRTRTLFQSVDKRFEVNTDGTVTLKRQVTLHEGHRMFSVHAWDSDGKKHTVSVKVERVHRHKEHHMDMVMNISSPESSTGLKRAKRWVIPPLQVPENSRGPFPMKLGQIKSDFSKETQMVYSISGEMANQVFTVDKYSGTLFVTQTLDREKKASYRLIAHAVARDVGNITENPLEILITVIDQNDNKPVFTQNPFNGHVHEAATKDYEFMTVTATDADDPDTDNGIVNYAIVSQEPQLPKPNMFNIDILSGSICVRETGMDREQWPRYTLLIVAADMEGNGLSATGTAVITITDSNDNPPQFEQTSYVVSVPENKVGALVAKLTVTDGDEVGSPAWSTKYWIISGDRDDSFNVSTGPTQLEGIINTVKPLDFEKTEQYVLSVIVENDDSFVGSLPTSTATVTVNVEDVNEPPEFDPKEKLIFKPENSPVDTELVIYTAIDPDTGKTQKITYKMGDDPAGWLNVSADTGAIKVRNLMDRESAYVRGGKYRAIVLAVDDDVTSPATGTGTLLIELENINDNPPVINERNLKMCNRGSAPVLLSITDKDGPPFAAPFIVETQGETSKIWSTSMNETSTGFYLQLKTPLKQGDYKVVLRVYDQYKLYQDSSIDITVCECTGDEVQCTNKPTAGMPLFGVHWIPGGILALLLLILLVLFLKWKRCTKTEPTLPDDDVSDNNIPEVFQNDVAPTFPPVPQNSPRLANREEIGTFIDDRLKAADNDPLPPPHDSLLVFHFEGRGSDAGSLSSLNSSSSGHDHDYDFLNEWGPRFKKLADMYGGGED